MPLFKSNYPRWKNRENGLRFSYFARMAGCFTVVFMPMLLGAAIVFATFGSCFNMFGATAIEGKGNRPLAYLFLVVVAAGVVFGFWVMYARKRESGE